MLPQLEQFGLVAIFLRLQLLYLQNTSFLLHLHAFASLSLLCWGRPIPSAGSIVHDLRLSVSAPHVVVVHMPAVTPAPASGFLVLQSNVS